MNFIKRFDHIERKTVEIGVAFLGAYTGLLYNYLGRNIQDREKPLGRRPVVQDAQASKSKQAVLIRYPVLQKHSLNFEMIRKMFNVSCATSVRKQTILLARLELLSDPDLYIIQQRMDHQTAAIAFYEACMMLKGKEAHLVKVLEKFEFAALLGHSKSCLNAALMLDPRHDWVLKKGMKGSRTRAMIFYRMVVSLATDRIVPVIDNLLIFRAKFNLAMLILVDVVGLEEFEAAMKLLMDSFEFPPSKQVLDLFKLL